MHSLQSLMHSMPAQLLTSAHKLSQEEQTGILIEPPCTVALQLLSC